MHPTLYRVISHLDKPRRIVSFTYDELVLFIFGLMLLVASPYKWLVGCFIGLLYSVLKHLKQGHGPRYLLIRMYWSLPAPITQAMIPHIPCAYQRIWRA